MAVERNHEDKLGLLITLTYRLLDVFLRVFSKQYLVGLQCPSHKQPWLLFIISFHKNCIYVCRHTLYYYYILPWLPTWSKFPHWAWSLSYTYIDIDREEDRLRDSRPLRYFNLWGRVARHRCCIESDINHHVFNWDCLALWYLWHFCPYTNYF